MISVVIPILNEEPSISPLSEKLTTALSSLGQEYEVIFVNDGSTDGTRARLREISLKDRHFKAVHFRRKSGQTAAMTAGFDHAQGDIIITMDGDLQNDPSDIGKLLAKLDEGYDLVSGWRVDRQDHLGRQAARILEDVALVVAQPVLQNDRPVEHGALEERQPGIVRVKADAFPGMV